MNYKLIPGLVLGLAALAASPAVFADHHESTAAADEAMVPASGFRADLLADLDRVEKKVLALADAVPADKYAWAPTPEVRNTAASYIHMAQANYQLLGALGVEGPEGVAEMETTITDKAGVKVALEGSFAAVKHAVVGLSDADLDTMVPFFGGEWSKRQVLMLVAGHCHEHLGQAIVYARSIGVVPPWSQPRAAADDTSDG